MAARGAREFLLVDGRVEVACGPVVGFEDALSAAGAAHAEPPSRLVVTQPSRAARAWLDAWAEDDRAFRRTLRVARCADGVSVVVVATLARHGFGLETALTVESVRAPHAAALVRTGVHAKVDVARLLTVEPT